MSEFATERLALMRGPAFSLFTDTNNRFNDHMSNLPAPDLDILNSYEVDCCREDSMSNASVGLYLVARSLNLQLQESFRGSDENSMKRIYEIGGVTNRDLRITSRYFYEHGFGDVDFIGKFAPAVANAVTLQMVEENYLSNEQQRDLTLVDWANMLGSKWFSSLVHQMTTTKFGMYEDMGGALLHFSYLALESKVAKIALLKRYEKIDVDEPFFSIQRVEEDGQNILTARLSEKTARVLRSGMDKSIQSEHGASRGQTYGCPVARYSGSLPAEALDTDLHLQKLIALGEIVIEPSRVEGRIRFKQEQTTIDRGLLVLAERIKRFESAHGTPYFTMSESNYRVTFAHNPPTNVS